MEELKKSSSGTSIGDKYIVNCQDKIIKDKTTKGWLENLVYLQTIPIGKAKMTDKKILEGFFDTQKRVVVKISNDKENSVSEEWDIFQQLSVHKLPNILHYYCFFRCYDDFTKINPIGSHQPDLCKDDGNGLNVLVMDYIKNKNLGEYPWKQNQEEIFRSCCKQVVCALANAYRAIGFRHGDYHSKNILIKHTKIKTINYNHIGTDVQIPQGGFKIYLMDFELSKMNTSAEKHLADFIEFFSSVHKNSKALPYQVTGVSDTLKYLTICDDGKSCRYDIDKLLSIIDKIRFV